MKTYIITVHQTTSDHRLDPDDLDYRPEGGYIIEAVDPEAALDIFHDTIPIACLEDYNIEWIELKQDLRNKNENTCEFCGEIPDVEGDCCDQAAEG